MLLLMPRLLVSAGTTLASCEFEGKPVEADGDRSLASVTRRDASLRFVHFTGFWSHFALDRGCSSWPIPESKRIGQLPRFARERQALAPSPAVGDIFLLGSAQGNSHVLAGIVAAVETVTTMLNDVRAYVCTTIEGELAPARPGALAPRVSVRLVRRRLSPAFGDCFIRWCELPAHASPVSIAYGEPQNLVRARRARPASTRRRAA